MHHLSVPIYYASPCPPLTVDYRLHPHPFIQVPKWEKLKSRRDKRIPVPAHLHSRTFFSSQIFSSLTLVPGIVVAVVNKIPDERSECGDPGEMRRMTDNGLRNRVVLSVPVLSGRPVGVAVSLSPPRSHLSFKSAGADGPGHKTRPSDSS